MHALHIAEEGEVPYSVCEIRAGQQPTSEFVTQIMNAAIIGQIFSGF